MGQISIGGFESQNPAFRYSPWYAIVRGVRVPEVVMNQRLTKGVDFFHKPG